MNSFDVVVIGGGVVGAAAFHRLAQQGLKVALLEKDRLCQGATSYSGGIVRCFHSDPVLSDMAVQGYHYYRQFAEYTDSHCSLTETGFIYLDKPERNQALRSEVDRLSSVVEMHWLTDQDAKNQFPFLNISSGQGVVYEPGAGYMDTYETTIAWAKAGERAGGVVIEGCQVERLLMAKDQFQGLQTNMGPIYAAKVVVCAGPLSTTLLEQAGLQTSVYAQEIQVNRFKSDVFPKQHPAYIDDEYNLNGRPDREGAVLVGYPTFNRQLDLPKSPIAANHTQLICEQADKRFSWAEAMQSLGGYRCLDSYTQNGHGEIKFVNENENIVVAAGFSGGGFKLAPAIAQRVDELINHK
ncbi:NAD(P)/FAD-dependent oxidoreductase [Pseudoalteromonas rubra]|uniref:FAD dependent oxidoreductase domain-containing protein n=1 Tax=Pseudoalteromonas rubra TaxID=43658 RepID=A0A0U2X017_9GAMM|nr:FAD-dependent oxidoreductase [Pseudoalteromonas rubra]ALU41732.1 hypothetical protein AT705_01600 [Pseudoalteromonas rubra]